MPHIECARGSDGSRNTARFAWRRALEWRPSMDRQRAMAIWASARAGSALIAALQCSRAPW